MKVYFIAGGYDGCYYVRCLLPLVQGGWWGAKTSIRGKEESKEQMLKGALSADIIVFQRPMQQEMLEAARILKEAGKKIVMDNDDTYKAHGGLPKVMEIVLERQVDEKMADIDKRLNEFASISDLVTVTTDFLKKEYEESSKNVLVLPNCVDPDDWPKPKHNDGDKVRIGLVGSVVMNNDTKKLVPLLRKWGRDPRIQLVVFGMPPKENQEIRKYYAHEIAFWNTMNIEWRPATQLPEYFNALNDLKLDIMLIPREDNYFNRCKSNVKYLEASMCEIPVVAQKFATGDSPYEADLPYIRLADTLEEWEQEVAQLVENKEMRRELGKKANAYVLENYNIKTKYNLWKEAYKKLLQ